MHNTTPFELNLSNELEVERQRFANKWLFPWHSINVPDRVVDGEDFRGGRIRVGGFLFEGQLQQIYWQAIERYLLAKVHEIFGKWDDETRTYGHKMRLTSLEGTEKLLMRFLGGTINKASDTDQRLRGRGFPQKVAVCKASSEHARVTDEIGRVMNAHRTLLIEDSVVGAKHSFVSSLFQPIEAWATRYRRTIAISALVAAIFFGWARIGCQSIVGKPTDGDGEKRGRTYHLRLARFLGLAPRGLSV